MAKSRFSVSASQINMFIECPSAWALRYHYGYKSAPSEKMMRGVHFEDKVNHYLVGGEYEDVTFGLSDEELLTAEVTASLIKDIFGDKDFILQKKLEDEGRLGFLDYSNDGHIVDLKTTGKTPSTPAKAHLRQLSLIHI